MRLYLDDIRQPYVGYELARTIDEAKAMMLAAVERDPVNGLVAVSLDHDLGACRDCMLAQGFASADEWLEGTNFKTMPNCEHVGTGYDLLKWMDEEDIWPDRIDVHSANPVGAQRMRDFIAGRGRRQLLRQHAGDVKIF
jgi:hypothetical protein